MRSPTVVARASMAVTAVVPSRIAAPASSLRRRCRTKLSATRRKNIAALLSRPVEDGNERLEFSLGDDHLAGLNAGLQRDRIAAAGLTHGRGHQRRRAHFAGDALLAHVEAHRPADVAGVRDGDDVAVRLAEEQETDLGGL